MTELSVDQAAAELHLDPGRIRQLLRGGKLKGSKLGGRKWLITEQELTRYKGTSGQPGEQEPREETPSAQAMRESTEGFPLELQSDGRGQGRSEASPPPVTAELSIAAQPPLIWTVEWLEGVGFPKQAAPVMLALYDLADVSSRRFLEELAAIKRYNPGMHLIEAVIRAALTLDGTQEEKEVLQSLIRYKVWEGEPNLNAWVMVMKIKQQEEERKKKLFLFLEALRKTFPAKQSASESPPLVSE